MKQRIGLLVGEAVEGMPWLGTFHSIGVKLLRRHAELAGLQIRFHHPRHRRRQVRLLKQIIQAEGLDDKRWPAAQFAQMIDGWKNKGLGPAEIPEGDARAFANGKGRELYTAYQDRLTTLNACDFGDLLLPPDPHLPRSIRMCSRNTTASSATSWSTSIRTPTPRNICGCGCWRSGRGGETGNLPGGGGEAKGAGKSRPSRDATPTEATPPRGRARRAKRHRQHLLRRRRRPVDLWLARRRGRQHPALREGFSGRHRHPAGAQLPLDRPYPRRRLASDRPQ